MATIAGLQSPNPYARTAYRAPVPTRATAPAATPVVDTQTHAVSPHPSYSPDWMQAENASAPQAAISGIPDIYGAKGEALKLPLPNPAANDSAISE
jgi:hypothetical protein